MHFHGCRVRNRGFRKVPHHNTRPDFQSLHIYGVIYIVLKEKQVQIEINQALNSSMTSSHAELKTKYPTASKRIQFCADVQKKKKKKLKV